MSTRSGKARAKTPKGKGKGKDGKDKGKDKGKGKNANADTVCWNCGRTGHMSYECWYRDDKGKGKGKHGKDKGKAKGVNETSYEQPQETRMPPRALCRRRATRARWWAW